MNNLSAKIAVHIHVHEVLKVLFQAIWAHRADLRFRNGTIGTI